MRAKEFLPEAPANLAGALRSMALQQKAAKTTGQLNPNAAKTGQGTQGTQGSVSATQATTGGQQTAQTSTTPAAPAKPGVMGSFISGLTGGKADSLGGIAKNAAASAGNKLGMRQTTAALQSDPNNPQSLADLNKPGTLDQAMSVQQGQTLDIPNFGQVKITKSGPQGLELDTSKVPGLGLPKVTINPKDLLKK
jgi:hypothetical protein